MKKFWLLDVPLIICVIMIRLLGAASIDGTAGVVFAASSVSFADGDIATGFVRFNGGFSVAAGASVSLNVVAPVKGVVDLHSSGKIILNGDVTFASQVTLPNGGVIDGQGNAIFLNGDLTIPRGKTLKIVGDTVIDGQGHELIFEDGATGAGGMISIAGNAGTTLTLRNVVLKGVKNYSLSRSIKFGSGDNQKLILNNVIMNLAGDFTFSGGGLAIYNDVVFSGAHTFTFRTSYDCTIAKTSTLMLDLDVIFKYWPADRARNHIVMQDRSSRLFLNGCTLDIPRFRGLQFTNGHVIVEHKSYVKSNGSVRDVQGVIWGDGTLEHDVLLDLMPGAALQVDDGIMTYNNQDVAEDVQ